MSEAFIELPELPGERWEDLLDPAGWPMLEQALPAYLRPRRWFSGKARALAALRVQAAIGLPYANQRAFLLLAHAEYADGGAELYVLPLAWAVAPQVPAHALVARVGAGVLFDPIYAPEFCAALLDIIAQQASVTPTHPQKSDADWPTVAPSAEYTLIGAATSAFAQLRGAPGTPLAPKVGTAEQSNSSIIFGDRLIMKLFRRIEPGVNPDLEIGAFLTERSHFAHVPPLAGTLELHSGGARLALAMLQGFVPNRGDAWYFTLDAIAAAFRGILRQRAEYRDLPAAGLLADAAQPLPAAAEALLGGYRAAAELLGRRTGELHLALAADPHDPAFAPEPFTPAFQQRVLAVMEARAQQSFAQLRTSAGGLPAELQPAAQRALALEGRVFEQLRQAFAQPLAAQRTRIHGDYHLGQVLATATDFLIIDFEGEPARPLSERREKGSPLQDVAGMLRSLHYAPFAVLFGQAPGVAFAEAERAQLAPWARGWHRWAGAAFLRSYMATVGAAWPAAAPALLAAYMLDKAVYELRYELNNRPGWAGIPLEGMLQLLGG